jgi:hypothetical protein
VSYNGKSFDSQILTNRCLMNGMRPPAYRHADLLHPVRRLWKKTLSDCSQGTVESCVLGIDRSGDTPGALAPEIWFSFLKSSDSDALLGVCDHNRRDIIGLAAIFAAMTHIAADPAGVLGNYQYDIEELALRWRVFPGRGGESPETLLRAGTELLHLAAEKGCPRAALVHALDMLRSGCADEGRRRLLAIAGSGAASGIRSSALRALAIDSEWRLSDAAEALALVNRALELPLPGNLRRAEFVSRAERLRKKLGRGSEA